MFPHYIEDAVTSVHVRPSTSRFERALDWTITRGLLLAFVVGIIATLAGAH